MICGAGIMAIMVLLYVQKPFLLSSFELKIFDTLVRSIPGQKSPNSPVIVDIDDRSLEQFGQWPWPRYRTASLMDKLIDLGALAVGIDILFSEPDRTSLYRIIQEMERDLNAGIPLPPISSELLDNDQAMISTLKKGALILGFAFSFHQDKTPNDGHISPKPVNIILKQIEGAPDDQTFLPKAEGIIGNIRSFSESAAGEGFFNIRPDPDGVLRRVPMLMEYARNIYPNLALATLASASTSKNLILSTSPHGVESLTVDERKIPLDEQGNLFIRFQGPAGTFQYYSASDVLNGKIRPDDIKNRIVFVGTSAAGLKDTHTTPYSAAFPGVEVHATIADTVLNGNFIVRPRWLTILELILTVFVGLSMSATLAWAPALVSLGVLFAGSISLWLGAGWSLEFKGVLFSPLYPLLTLIASFSVLSLLKFRIEEKKVLAKTKELNLVQQVTIETVANVAETRDPETGGHIKRTQHYVRAFAEYLSKQPEYKKRLDRDEIDLLFQSAPLHDLGKVGVPDYVLLKPDRLTEEEFAVMKRHTTYANDIITSAEHRLGNSSFLRVARELAYTHQEKWDGSGYPQGLKGEEIPLAGRIMAIADVYDALISRRPYKDKMPHEAAVAIIIKGSGTHFDPKLVEAFLQMSDEFKKIASRFIDPSI
ncbi:MAG: CHASE2 domain-containing protein [Thermodesulfobacteriota bacterium]